MKNIFPLITRVITSIENTPLTPWLWIAAFISIIFARLLTENWLGGFSYRNPQFLFNEFTHTFLFFLFSYLLFLPLLAFAARVTMRQAANVLLWGFLIILTPPYIDYVLSGGAGFWSFYEFDGLEGLLVRFFTFFGENPTMGITYGVRVEVALSLFLFFFYIRLKTKDFTRAFLGAFLAYVLFFILGTFPSWITIATLGWTQGFFSIRATDVAGMFLSPETTLSYTPGAIINALNAKMSLIYALLVSGLIVLLAWIYEKQGTLTLLGNARWPQVLYHGGLVCVGGGIALVFSSETLTHATFFNVLAFLLLMLAAVLAWLSSVIVNDLFDEGTDRISNPDRPLVGGAISKANYAGLGGVLAISSLMLAALTLPYALFLFLIYHALTWAYNAPPFRLKRLPIIATFTGAVASLMVLFAGFLAIDTSGTLEFFPGQIAALLLFAYTVSLPLKDLKDIAGDKKTGTWTIPVLLGEKRARYMIGLGIFASYVASVITFNLPTLAPWAILLGGASFLVISQKSLVWRNIHLSTKYLPHTFFTLVFIYGLVLVFQIL